jgi:hypothetical protein
VRTREGLKSIEEIKIGHHVLSKPGNGGGQARKRVLRTLAHPPERVIEVQGQELDEGPARCGDGASKIGVSTAGCGEGRTASFV